MTKQGPEEGRQRETNLEIMTKQDPIEGRQRETKGDKPGNHDETRSSRRETKGDKPGDHDETRHSRRKTFHFPSASTPGSKRGLSMRLVRMATVARLEESQNQPRQSVSHPPAALEKGPVSQSGQTTAQPVHERCGSWNWSQLVCQIRRQRLFKERRAGSRPGSCIISCSVLCWQN